MIIGYDVQDIAQELSEKLFFEEGRTEVSKGDCEKAIDAAYPGMYDYGNQKIFREWVECGCSSTCRTA
ncbi:hypothetical protein [uncultured Sutterella sp.]|uniref:hypothetical protein n=1 Tax=uncultured Sutterella sp. TaxID=286133 RepID=UPI0020486344|nr:hypothetical protein [uncultured Sutterella sp.]DAL55842.1 MAG TPA_asm: hypothetical protein [Caudoviricetes sp.]